MLDGHSCVVWQSRAFIWGGKEESTAEGGPVYYSNTVYSFDPAQAAQSSSIVLERVRLIAGESAMSITPEGRAYHSAVLYGKLMLVTGGLMDEREGDAENAHLPAFNLESRAWSIKSTFGDIPCPRCHHVTAIHAETMFLHGGYPLLGDRRRDITAEEMSTMQHAMYDVFELNMATLRWRTIQVTHTPTLWGHTAIVYNKNIVVFGGVDVVENTESGSVAVWHTEKKQWRWADFKDLNLQCAMHAAVEEGGKMYVFGGISFRSSAKLSQLFEFSLDFGSWRELKPSGVPPRGRIGHAAIASNNCVFIIGGTVDTAGPTGPTGAAQGAAQGALGGGRAERVVHVYNIQLDAWHACALHHPTADRRDTGDASAMSHDVSTISGPHAAQNTAAESAHRWELGYNDPHALRQAESEFQSISSKVHTALQSAKAVQNLATGALKQLENAPPGARRYGGTNQSPYSSSGVTRDEGSYAPNSNEAVGQMESRRVIEHLKSENEALRAQLQQIRTLGTDAGAGDPTRNPYEVPMFNMQSGALAIGNDLANASLMDAVRGSKSHGGDDVAKRAAQAIMASDDHYISTKISDMVPRLNLNVADPPRAIGGSSTGFMTRNVTSSLVQSSLQLDKSATALLALPPPSHKLANANPTSYLSGPSSAAIDSYENLIGTRGVAPGSQGAMAGSKFGMMMGGGHSSVDIPGAPPLPMTLAPLMALLAGSMPVQNVQQSSDIFGGSSPNRGGGGGGGRGAPSAAMTGGNMGISNRPAAESLTAGSKSPSLRKIVSGSGSMLSMLP